MAEDTTASPEEQKPQKKLPLKTILIVIAVLLMEGATITIVKVFFAGPSSADAANVIEDTTETPNVDMAEVILAEDFVANKYVGTKARIIVNMDVSAKVEKVNQKKLETLVTEHKTEILDTIRTLVSGADAEHIRDSQLQVIKREIKTGVEKIVGPDLVDEILLPGWQPYASD